MPRRQPSRQQKFRRPLAKIWLMTDPRLRDRLLAAVRGLPRGSGVVFRHYDLPEAQRAALFARIRRICRQRGHMLLVAGTVIRGGDGVHGRTRKGHAGLRSMAVHDLKEISDAKRMGAALLFLSPLHATRSHPGARPLGMMRFAMLAKRARPAKVIALGGMTRSRAQMIKSHVAYGWAAIDAFM